MSVSLGKNKSKQKSSQTSSENWTRQDNPYAPVMPYLNGALGDAAAMYGRGGFSYGGDTYAGLTDQQRGIIGQGVDLGTGGTAGMDAADGFVTQLLQGKGDVAGTLTSLMSGGPNPYLDATFDRAFDKVSQAVGSNAAGLGRAGSGFASAALADAGSGLATSIYGGAYDADQNRRLSAANALGGLQSGAAGMAQDLFGTRLRGLGAASDMAGLIQRDQQGELDDAQARSMAGAENLSNYLQILLGIGGAGGSSSGTGNAFGTAKGSSSGFNMGGSFRF